MLSTTNHRQPRSISPAFHSLQIPTSSWRRMWKVIKQADTWMLNYGLYTTVCLLCWLFCFAKLVSWKHFQNQHRTNTYIWCCTTYFWALNSLQLLKIKKNTKCEWFSIYFAIEIARQTVINKRRTKTNLILLYFKTCWLLCT